MHLYLQAIKKVLERLDLLTIALIFCFTFGSFAQTGMFNKNSNLRKLTSEILLQVLDRVNMLLVDLLFP